MPPGNVYEMNRIQKQKKIVARELAYNYSLQIANPQIIGLFTKFSFTLNNSQDSHTNQRFYYFFLPK